VEKYFEIVVSKILGESMTILLIGKVEVRRISALEGVFKIM